MDILATPTYFSFSFTRAKIKADGIADSNNNNNKFYYFLQLKT